MASSHMKLPLEITQTTTRHTCSSSCSHQINRSNLECTFLIIGGGIAGVSCVETISFLAPDEKIIILSESPLIKSVKNLVQLGKYIQRFDVNEVEPNEFETKNVQVILDQLKFIKSKSKLVETVKGSQINYKIMCICTGASPKLIDFDDDNLSQVIIGIRDTHTVKEFQERIKKARQFVLVGNGGIASEIAYEIRNVDIDWIIKDHHISSTFIDVGAAEFFKENLQKKNLASNEKTIVKRMQYMEESSKQNINNGAALGPDWHRQIDMSEVSNPNSGKIKTHFGVELKTITRNLKGEEYPITVELTDGSKITSDFVVSATGVHPNMGFDCDEEFLLGLEGGLNVNELFKTSIDSIYAAGDVCYAGWEHSQFWHQMRLWTQARQMGTMAGKSMVAQMRNEEVLPDFCFELFSHVTKLYDYQVILLGKFNAQGLADDYELLLRITPDKEYIKFVLKNGRLVGALLIGETGMEETCENLILNQIDLTPFGDDILNPNIDIEDYFD